MSSSEGTGTAKRYSKKAVSTLQDAKSEFQQSPLFQIGRDLALSFAQNPESLPPEVVALLKANVADTAQNAARSNLDQGLSGLTGTSGVRSGAANGLRAETASRLGSDIATGQRDIDIAAAQQRPADILNAVNLVSQILGQQFQFDRDISNAYLGSGSLLAQIGAQPSTLQQIGQGIFGTLGNVTSAAGSAGGFGSLFGGQRTQ